MKRRDFCGAGLAALAGSALPYTRVFAATAGDVPAIGLDGKQLLLRPGDVEDLRKRLRGALLAAGSDSYDSARLIWNRAFDRKPALIARCEGAADVIEAVRFARAQGLLTAVRGGGHSLSGQSVCDGGLVIDLGRMQGIRIDPTAKSARVEPGVKLTSLDQEAQSFGMVVPLGTVSDTGAAGLTLGGGFGRLTRKYGLACDNLMAADVITADGRLVRASATENPDLLWALRGGGGNFGVVTSFQYRLHPVGPAVFGGHLLYPFAQAREVLRAYADVSAGAPDELAVSAYLVPTPDNQRAVMLDVCYCGGVADGERVVAPLRKLGKPLQDNLGPTTYVEVQRSGDADNPPGPYYIKGGYVTHLSPALIDSLVESLGNPALGNVAVILAQVGGAISRVKPNATAFWHREPSHEVIMVGFWEKPADADHVIELVRGVWKPVEPLTDGFYINHGGFDVTERRIRENYGDNYRRLADLKKRYDPANLFRLNANIKPA